MSQSYSWKQYLYAFILRRALGPYLTSQSAADLRTSIQDVDWSEGKIVLVDVELDADYLNGLIASNNSSECDSDESNSLRNVTVKKAKIQRFGINFSLAETSASGNDQVAPTSTARKATSALIRNIFGSIDECSLGISLVVHIELDGIDIEFTPCGRNTKFDDVKQSAEIQSEQLDNKPSEASATTNSVDQDEVASSFFSSLVDSAMKSLRLSINVKEVKLHLLTLKEECQIAIQLASAQYYDLMDGKKQLDRDIDEAEKMIVSKAIDWTGIVIEMSGTRSHAQAHKLLQQSGEGHVRFRCYEKWQQKNIDDSSEPSIATGRREIDVSLGQHVAVDAECFILNQLVIIINALSSENLPENDPSELDENDLDSTQDYTTPKLALADEFTREAYDEVMKQYTEARHLARTREIRGGVLIPSFEGETDTGEVSFDAFFDANDHSISFYRDMMMDDSWSANQNDKKHIIATVTKVDFGLPEFTFKLGYGEFDNPDSSDSVLLSMGGLQFIMYSEDEETKINASISHFEVESQETKNQSTVSKNMLRFLDQTEANRSDLLVSSPPCISAYVELPKSNEGDTCSRIDLVLQSLEITFMHNVVSGLIRIVTLAGTKQQSPTDLRSTGKAAFCVSVSCESLVVLMPCTNVIEADPLFTRCGYPLDSEDLHLNPFLGLGVEIDNISVDFSDKCDEVKAVTKFNYACLFAKHTKLVSARRSRKRFVSSSYASRRTDLLACAAEQDRASDSQIVVSCTRLTNNEGDQRGKRRATSFPIILPLSSSKTRQDDSDNEDDFFEDIMNSPGNTDSTKGTDSQYIMSSEASEAQQEVVINIPCVSLDLALCEKNELISILSDILSHTGQCKPDDHIDSSFTGSNSRNWSSVVLKVGQLSVVLLGNNEQIASSYSLVGDNIHIHALVDRLYGLRNARFSAADFTLYELSNLIDSHNSQPDKSSTISCAERCRRVRDRMILKSIFSVVRAIFFRSKLSQPLSPDYPAILIDIILSRNHDSNAHSVGEELHEKNVYFSVYDMTYRYSVGSEWHKHLRLLFQGQSTGNTSPLQTEELEKGIPCLTNLFVSVTDCNFDYTTPMAYKTASRSVLRIGEVQLSSNLMTPCSEMQAYKLSLNEVGVFVCNYRHPYSDENASLSCAHRHFNEEQISVANRDINQNERAVSTLVSTLSHMDFVNVVALDSVDAAILVNRACCNTLLEKEKDPATTVALTIEKINCNFCQDSFTTTADTFNEWLLRFTALSEEELDTLKSISEQKTLQPLSTNNSGSNTDYEPPRSFITSRSNPDTSSSEVFRADSAAVDKLTNTLLYQNYYTIDATNRPPMTQSQQMMQTPLTVVESSSSDDEWAAVEHAYLRNSNIPRDNEQRAEWIMCDTDSESIKVFPQHFSAKPLLDCEGNHYADAEVAGTHKNPRVGLRFIVNDASISLHFFDGMDWTTSLPKKSERDTDDRRRKLLIDLLGDEEQAPGRTLNPLPDERSEILKRNSINKKLRRNYLRYFSVSASGLRLSNDSYVTSSEHQLASSLDLSISDLFVAETISNDDPTKMLGEWVNEAEHPRDDSDGVIMLKMLTRHPAIRVSSDGKLMSDESQATLELLPLRCFFHQTSIRFIRSFFAREVSNADSSDGEDDMEIIPIFFSSFKVKPAKLKVDYIPSEMDVNSFRDGNYIELLNLCPFEDMIFTLQAVENRDLTGWGSVFGELASRWIEDIGKTQSHKFFTRATPFSFFSGITEGAADLVMVLVVPESDSFVDYLKDVLYSSTSFASKLACETLTTSAKLTRYAAQLNAKDLQPRPKVVPRHIGDAAGHSVESITRGLRAANYKIVTVPLREYQSSGASVAARSAVRGLPIAVLAPLSGASEALSYSLLGLRNSMRPDIRKEAEASLRGLN